MSLLWHIQRCLIEDISFLCNFSHCYILSKTQRNDIVLSEERQVPWKPYPLSSPDTRWDEPLLSYFKWGKEDSQLFVQFMWQINERNRFCGTKADNISSSLSGLPIDLKFCKSFLNKFVFVEGYSCWSHRLLKRIRKYWLGMESSHVNLIS